MAQLPTVGGDQDSWGDILNEYLLVSHTQNGRVKPLVVSYPYAGTITPNINTTEVANVGILTGDISIANPTGTPIDGQMLAFRFAQDGTGSHAISWDTMYAFDTSGTSPNILVAANATWEMSFRWNAGTSLWYIASDSVTVSQAGSGYADRTFNPTLTFDVAFKMSTAQTGNISFALGASPVADVIARVIIVGDGTHSCTFPGDWVNANGQTFDNTQRNIIYFEYDGTEVLYSVIKVTTPDVTPPVLASAVVENTNKNKVVLTYSELLANVVPSPGDFALNIANTINSVTVAGSTVTLVCASNFSHDDVITVSYTPGTNKTQDLAGNLAAGFSAHAVVNNVSIINTSLSVGAINQIPGTTAVPSALAFGSGGTDTPVSIAFWFKDVSLSGSKIAFSLLRPGGSGSCGVLLLMTAGMVQWFIAGNGGINTEHMLINNTSVISRSVWNHVVLTYSGNKSVAGMKMYINGASVAVTTNLAGTYLGQVALSSDHILEVGGGNLLGSETPFTGCLLDEYYWFNKELSPTEVTEIYNAGSIVDPSALSFASNLRAGYKFDNSLLDAGSNNYNLTSSVAPTYSTDTI